MHLYAMAYHYAAPSNSQILPAQEWNIVMEVMEPCKAVGNPTFGGCGRDYIHGIFPFWHVFKCRMGPFLRRK